MKPLRTRNDLIELAQRHAPTKACERTMRMYGATVLGGFTFAGGNQGWIVTVSDKWNIAIICHETARKYSIDYLDDVPWTGWLGRINGKRPLVDGDCPALCSLQRLRARSKERCRQSK